MMDNPLGFVEERFMEPVERPPLVTRGDGYIGIWNTRFHYLPKSGVDINLQAIVLTGLVSAGLMGLVWAIGQRFQVLEYAKVLTSYVRGQPPIKG